MFSPGGGIGVPGLGGAGDVVLVPDPATFRVLPWAERTGWVLCDLRFPDGTPVPLSTRGIALRALDGLAARGFDLTSGWSWSSTCSARTTRPRSRRADGCCTRRISTRWTTSCRC